MARADDDDDAVALFRGGALAHSPAMKALLAELERASEGRGRAAHGAATAMESFGTSMTTTTAATAAVGTTSGERTVTTAMAALVDAGARMARVGTAVGGATRAEAERRVGAVRDAREGVDAAKKEYDGARARAARATGTSGASADAEANDARARFERARKTLMTALQRFEAWDRTRERRAIGAFLRAQLEYYQRGVEILSALEPVLERQAEECERVERESADAELALAEEMDKLVFSPEGTPQTTMDALSLSSDRSRALSAQMASSAAGYGSSDQEPLMQGYLLKRSSGKIQDWKRRFFVLDTRGNLTYVKSTPSHPGRKLGGLGTLARSLSRRPKDQDAVSEGNGGDVKETVSLLTSTIKPDLGEDASPHVRHAFRIVSPERTFFLRAESAAEQTQWIEAITTAIANLLNSSVNEQVMADHEERTRKYGSKHSRSISSASGMSAPEGPAPIVVLSQIPGNDKCAECSMPEPDWASLNLGVMMCLQCSGVHRQLGVQVSKVRSATLDVRAWDRSTLEFFKRWGNTEANAHWEAELQAHERAERKPKPHSSLEIRKAFILEKYVARVFCKRSAPPTESQLLTAINHKNLVGVMEILLAGCRVKMDYIMLTAACDAGDAGFAIVEALIHHGFDLNAVEGPYTEDTTLHYAMRHERAEFAKVLIRRGADPLRRNGRGKTPFDVAVDVHGAIRDDELLVLLSCPEFD